MVVWKNTAFFRENTGVFGANKVVLEDNTVANTVVFRLQKLSGIWGK